ncbi:MAG: type II secretion system protein [Acidobacteriota bacterium]|nr:type II secretion system protein [Acidobacteriota bacterium]
MVTIRRGRTEDGYNLVAVIVAITVLSILVAAALPAWSHQYRRAKEEEAIFRGLQYAEAIRVFQKRFGRYPTRIEELLEVRPRSIRQLWTDPLSEHGEFGLIVGGGAAGQGQSAAPGQAPGARQTPNAGGLGQRSGARGAEGRDARGGLGGQGQSPLGVGAQGDELGGGSAELGGARTGQGGGLIRQPRVDENGEPIEVSGLPIQGVYLDLEGQGTRLFLGESDYAKWDFVVALIPIPQAVGERPLPSARSDWIGKPFPQGMSPRGIGPGGQDGARGQEPGGSRDGDANRGRPGFGDRGRQRDDDSGFGSRSRRGRR